MIVRVLSSERDRVMGTLSKSQDRTARAREGQGAGGGRDRRQSHRFLCAASLRGLGTRFKMTDARIPQ